MGRPILPHLAERHRQAEWMDQPGLNAQEHARALRGLARINQISRSAAVLWPKIARVAHARGGGTVRVLDLASGGGDVAIALARWAARLACDLRMEGCDLSPEAVRFAQKQARRRRAPIRFFQLDALRDPLPDGYDIVMCSLFLHHLAEPDAVGLLRKMAAAAGSLVLVDDLIRSRRGYGLAWLGCRILSGSPVVHHDGPVSVSAAFTVSEARALAERAGLRGAVVTRHWPERFLLAWSRPEENAKRRWFPDPEGTTEGQS
jgi:SAM-dependent methyltransferase